MRRHRAEARRRDGLTLASRGPGKAIELEIRLGSVEVGQAIDTQKQSLEEQAYRLEINDGGIRITANGPAGLFYGANLVVRL